CSASCCCWRAPISSLSCASIDGRRSYEPEQHEAADTMTWGISRRHLDQALVFAVTAGLVLLLSVPFFWVITSSFKPVYDIFAIPPKIFPWPPTLDNYVQAWEQTPFPR